MKRMYETYPALHIIKPRHIYSVRAKRLDAVLAEQGISVIDAIKLDTQGSELDILRGGTTALKSCLLVDIEVEFNPLYEGQNLFCDVDRFLRDHGFVLWRFGRLAHYSTANLPGAEVDIHIGVNPPGRFIAHATPNGQLYWGEAQYVKANLHTTP